MLEPRTARYLRYGAVIIVGIVLLSVALPTSRWVENAAIRYTLLGVAIGMLALIALAVLWDLLVRIPREAASEGAAMAQQLTMQRQALAQQQQAPSSNPEDFRTLILVLPFPVLGNDLSKDPAVAKELDRQRRIDGTPSTLISSIAFCAATADGHVTMIVVEAATRKQLWEGEIGKLTTAELPVTDLQTPRYQAAVEAQIRALAKNALD